MYPIKQSTAITGVFFAHDVAGDAVLSMVDGGFTKRISKNGAAFGAMTVTITEMENGWYSFPLDTGHSDTNGILSITFTNASCKQVNLQFRVETNLVDDIATDVAAVQSDTDDIQTRLPAALVSGAMDCDVSAIQANAINNAAFASNAVSSAELAPSCIGASQIATAAIDTDSIALGAITTAAFTANAINASALATDAVEEIRDAILVASSGTATSGSTTTLVDTSRTDTYTDQWVGNILLITNGNIAGQARRISAYDNATDTFTVEPALSESITTHTYMVLQTAIAPDVALATVCTETRLAELDAGNLPTDIAAIPTTMVGTDNAALASVCTETRLSELDEATGGKMANQVDVIQTDTTTDIPATITTLQADTDDIQTRLPAALVGGAMDSDVSVIQTDAISAAAMSAAAAQKIRDEILPTQNAAFNNIQFLFVDSTDHVTPVTAAGTMAVTRSIDGGAFGAGTGTGPTEISDGIYQYDASAADMNGGIITFRFTATTGTPNAPDDRFLTIVTGGGV